MSVARLRLGKAIIESAKPRAQSYVLWDGELRGFGVRIEPTGTKSFILRYRPRGLGTHSPKRFLTIGRFRNLTPDEARLQAKRLLGAVALGEDPAAELAESKAATTISELVEVFLREHVRARRKASTARGYEVLFRSHTVPTIGNLKASALTRGDIEALHLRLAHMPYQANRLLAAMSSLFTFAQRRGLVSEGWNPAQKIERYAEDRRERFLSADELGRLGAALNEAETVGIPWNIDPSKPTSKHLPGRAHRLTKLSTQATAAIRLLIFTGARLREILHLRWDHIDFDRGLLLLPDSKTGRKTVVLNVPALSLLRHHPRLGNFVISGDNPTKPRADLTRPWTLVRRRAALAGVRLHDLRHTFASIGAGASLGLPIVGKLLGHNHPQTTARYAHLDADPLRRASNLIGQHLSAALESKVHESS